VDIFEHRSRADQSGEGKDLVETDKVDFFNDRGVFEYRFYL
jgi:hypothetical protein